MSLPVCPVGCGRRDLPLVDTVATVYLAPEGSTIRYLVSRLRTYRCPCGASYRTRETVEIVNPVSISVRKLAADESAGEQPAG